MEWVYDEKTSTWFYGRSSNGCRVFQHEELDDMWAASVHLGKTSIRLPDPFATLSTAMRTAKTMYLQLITKRFGAKTAEEVSELQLLTT